VLSRCVTDRAARKEQRLQELTFGGLGVLSWCLHQSPGSGESTCSSARRVNPVREWVNQTLENSQQSLGQSAQLDGRAKAEALVSENHKGIHGRINREGHEGGTKGRRATDEHRRALIDLKIRNLYLCSSV